MTDDCASVNARPGGRTRARTCVPAPPPAAAAAAAARPAVRARPAGARVTALSPSMGAFRARLVRRGCLEFRVMAMLRRRSRFKIVGGTMTRVCASVRAPAWARDPTGARARARRARILARRLRLVHNANQIDGENAAEEVVPNGSVMTPETLTIPKKFCVEYKVLASDEGWCLISLGPGQVCSMRSERHPRGFMPNYCTRFVKRLERRVVRDEY